MVLAMVESYMGGNRGFELDVVTTDYVKVMRLRVLWLIMCGSVMHPINHDETIAVQKTGKELEEVFVKKSAKVW